MALAEAWESLKVVRRRFRVGADWIHIPLDDEGEEMLASNDGVKANHQVLICIINDLGLKKLTVASMQTEVPRTRLDPKLPSIDALILNTMAEYVPYKTQKILNPRPP